MKKNKIMPLVAIMIVLIWQDSIYNYSVPGINGESQDLSAFQGKKILIITLPIQQSAATDTMLYCLDTLATAHAGELKVIATPSYEDGFTSSQKEQLKQWYQSKLSANILVTDGLYTRKTSGTQQHGLFKWLTTDSSNEVFNIDIDGPNYKFFVSSSGRLYGMLRPQSKVGGIAVNRTLNAQ